MAQKHRREERERPYTEDTVFLIRLWYLGKYRGCEAIKKLSVRQIAYLLQRSEKNVREALGEYYVGVKK